MLHNSNRRSTSGVKPYSQATKIILQRAAPALQTLTAEGVIFSVGSANFTAKARKEVILSAGSVQTPQLLELSGAIYSLIL